MDKRHCDGPNCKEAYPADAEFALKSWITLDRGERYNFIGGANSQRELHFHSYVCLNEWTKENTRRV